MSSGALIHVEAALIRCNTLDRRKMRPMGISTIARFLRRAVDWAATAISACLFLASAANAGGLPAPTGEVILTLSGNIQVRNAGENADFDLAMLQALPSAKIKTMTPWTTGIVEFEGVPIGQLMEQVGASGQAIRATALNDYAVDIPLNGAIEEGAIIAYRVDGKELPVRDKGPLWIMFPFDARPELKSETYYSQCVWQLRTMTIQ